jgi:hypothetical protein
MYVEVEALRSIVPKMIPKCFSHQITAYMFLLTVLSKVSLHASLFVNIIVVSVYNFTVSQELSMLYFFSKNKKR